MGGSSTGSRNMYIYLLLLLSLFISLFLSILLSSCNIFGMLRMYSDSICYESPEVACITGAGTSLRVPGKISVPILAKHIHLLALFPSLSDISFTIKSSTLFNLPQTTIYHHPKKLSQSLPISRYSRFYITTNPRKRGKGGEKLCTKKQNLVRKIPYPVLEVLYISE